MFPKLLPEIMSKVMPVMLQHIPDRIPVPDYIAKHMSKFKPKIIDNIMPHMIVDVVHLIKKPLLVKENQKNKIINVAVYEIHIQG
ncbi:MAG: hypothetical protein NTV30_02095 [Chloroflexi bacterium]|nr:hypothetical protein [Chloroflexota bacterium]